VGLPVWFGAYLICASLALASFEARAGSAVYRFTDDRGVVHFSNVPMDRRFEAVNLRPKATGFSKRTKSEAPVHRGYDDLILRQARVNRLDPGLVKAVIAAESNFSPDAISRAGAEGLMQLMPETARQLGVDNSFEPVENVSGGSRYLREMLDRFGDLRRALAAYNAGPEVVDRYDGIPPYPETEAYVERVLAYYRGYRGDFHR
jgi:soluble lytic murein transglycosylase